MLKQVKRLWNKKIVKFFSDLGFIIINKDPYIFFYRDLINNIIIIINIYINNIIIISNCDKAKDKIKI